MYFTLKRNNQRTKKPVNRFLQDGASAGIRSLQTSTVIKLCQTLENGERVEKRVGWLKNHVTLKPLQINILFLTTLPTMNACNSPFMQYYFKRFFVLHSSEVIFSFLIKKSRQKAIKIEIAFFPFPLESQGSHIGPFLLCLTYPS